MKKTKLKIFATAFILFISIIFISENYSQTSVGKKNIPTYKVVFLKNLFTEVNYNDAAAALKVWIEELGTTLSPSFKLDVILLGSIEEIQQYQKQNEVALITLNAVDYLQNKDKLNLEGAFVPLINGKAEIEYILLTKKNLNTIGDLGKSKIGMLSVFNSPMPHLWLDVILAKKKMTEKEKHFIKIVEAENESKLILSLFFGQIDACIVKKETFDLMVELNSQLGNQLKIIDTLKGMIASVTCFPESFKSKKNRQNIINASKQLNSYTIGKQIYTFMKIGGVERFKEEDISEVKKLLNDHKKYCENNLK